MTYAIERMFDEVEQKGLEEGIKKGRQEGRQEGTIAVAVRMLKKGKDVYEVHELTDLAVEKIMELKEEAEK